ncbi:MAG TPA: ClpXP protease specificity-enhancing factor SspB [Minicystis sp.]|nr:ClpXP protease specificity-enhancing factor SspB [Minicystis sp.]
MPDAPRQLPPKKEVALALLEGPSLFVHLDPRRPGVIVPKWFTGQPQLVLQLGLNMAIPIPDLRVEDDGVSCTLSFNRAPFWCRLPWSAIYALVGEDGRGMVWPDDVPPEVALQMQKQQGVAAKQAIKKGRPKLNAVATPADEARGRVRRRPPPPAESGPGEDGPFEAEADARTREPGDETPIESEPPRVAAAADEARADGDDDAARSPSERAPEGSSGSSPPGKKPKRELPPYLRVIK